jgi:hypothetical protein
MRKDMRSPGLSSTIMIYASKMNMHVCLHRLLFYVDTALSREYIRCSYSLPNYCISRLQECRLPVCTIYQCIGIYFLCTQICRYADTHVSMKRYCIIHLLTPLHQPVHFPQYCYFISGCCKLMLAHIQLSAHLPRMVYILCTICFDPTRQSQLVQYSAAHHRASHHSTAQHSITKHRAAL